MICSCGRNQGILRTMFDFERIMGRVVYQTAMQESCPCLKNSIENLPLLKRTLGRAKCPYLQEIYEKLDPLENTMT